MEGCMLTLDKNTIFKILITSYVTKNCLIYYTGKGANKKLVVRKCNKDYMLVHLNSKGGTVFFNNEYLFGSFMKEIWEAISLRTATRTTIKTQQIPTETRMLKIAVGLNSSNRQIQQLMALMPDQKDDFNLHVFVMKDIMSQLWDEVEYEPYNSYIKMAIIESYSDVMVDNKTSRILLTISQFLRYIARSRLPLLPLPNPSFLYSISKFLKEV